MAPQNQTLDVLYEDNHLLAVNKPALLPTMGVAPDEPSLLRLAKEWLRQKYEKPGAVYLGVVSRLDAPVTGVLLVAKTSKAAARLSEAFRARQVRKLYVAAVAGRVDLPSGTLEHFLRKDERHRKVHVTHAGAPDAQAARLDYRMVAAVGEFALLEVEPETGRKHQIRVQLAKVGHPILGDMKYGGPPGFSPGIALHARQLELEHPVRREPLSLEAPLPRSWHSHPGVRRLVEAWPPS
ncbi:MAG TPA: RluA family pseudouridine synthase [Lacipirellulaceae bacterium]|nr:RluA family pseudouridine synthase [Lacipirellulaceae bacterium]